MEENKLRQYIGKNEPFKVPEGYFDSFADRLQSRIAELPQAQNKPTKHVHLVLKAWFAAAASIVIVASVGLSIMIPRWNADKTEVATPVSNEIVSATNNDITFGEEAFYDELDYAMIDNNEIAYYLTEY